MGFNFPRRWKSVRKLIEASSWINFAQERKVFDPSTAVKLIFMTLHGESPSWIADIDIDTEW